MNLSDQNNPRISASKESANIRARKKILLLEPDKEQAELFSNWLKEEGYEVTALLVLDEAINIVSQDGFGLFIIDIDNPQIAHKYFTLCQAIKQDPRTQDLPVAVLTYRKDIKKIISAIEAKADSFVLKPFETDAFLKRIKTIFKQVELKKKGRKFWI